MAEQEEKETVKGQCPHCGDERNCEVHGRVKKQWEWSDRSGNSVDGLTEHLFLECKGCETIFYESISCNSEDVEYWYDHNGDTQSEYVMHRTTYPKPTSRIKPSWLSAIVNTDMTLYTILDEMYLACDNGTYILTAIGLRTALDRAMEVFLQRAFIVGKQALGIKEKIPPKPARRK